MKHARPDYNRIQDPAKLIPEDEPVFLIRAQDKVAPAALEFYADLAAGHGASQQVINSVVTHAQAMRAWQRENGSKVPDMPVDEPNDD